MKEYTRLANARWRCLYNKFLQRIEEYVFKQLANISEPIEKNDVLSRSSIPFLRVMNNL